MGLQGAGRALLERGVLLASLLVAALIVLAPGVARADEARLRFLSEKMRDGDPRVRTSAALALGASNEDGAVDPLCGGLGDREDVVRQAAAVALKRLSRSRSLECLRNRERVESNEAVKIAVTRAIEAIASSGDGGGGGGGEQAKENPNAKYYISLSTVANQTGRAQTEVERIVLASVRQKLEAAGVVQLAPTTESPDKARDVMRSRKMKGFYLALAVDRFDYADGNLRVKVKIGVFNYPNKSLLGNIDKTLTAQGVSSGDKASEDRLLELAAGLASEQFAQNASAFL
ncbi:MAG: HEAT repeat domain-containing protein [Labilithrix sp.]|nr:HEAT repeat domain-containing protein [Labilithrix sp.]MBX3223206.1 HEAT repeat domain-containing protein [Labilithrix sp.]